jgi:metallo-beta-lactamase family protein
MSTPSLQGLIRVTFEGAAQTVTGSMHLVETAHRQLLLDCGLFQGRRAESRQRNSHFPFAPQNIAAVLLSHAHIDHCGNLPNLVKSGFRGSIYCTPATRDLIAIMLEDSARIQAEDADYLNHKRERGEPKIEPLYDEHDVVATLRLCHAVPYDRPFELGRGIEARFVDAGHLLGSAMVSLRVHTDTREARLTFTGDLGRRGQPILRDPAPVPECDLLISESTYGGKKHDPPELLAEHLGEIVQRTYARGGKLLIPAFSLGRTQTVLYQFHELVAAHKLPSIPIFVDSPLALEATEVFRLHPECFSEETLRLLDTAPDLFGGRYVHYIRSVEESKALNQRNEPCIIIAASGMCEAGRILHHLKHNIEDARNTVLLVGHQAPDTLGRRLVERHPQVRVLNRLLSLRAEVVALNGFSSHADHDDFLACLGPLAGKTKMVRLVHGEPDSAAALAQALSAVGFADVSAPKRGESVEICEAS